MTAANKNPLWACLALAATAATADPFPKSATVRAFDFGTPQSEVRPGFERVTKATVYSKETGFGFLAPGDSTGFFWSHAGHKMSKNQIEYWGKGRDIPPPCYTDELTSDGLRGRQQAVFRVDLPDGQYRLFLVFGDSAGGGPGFYDGTLTANGEPLGNVTLRKRFHYEVRRYKASVAGGKLELTFSTPGLSWIVNSLVAYGMSDRNLVEPFLEDIELDIFFMPKNLRGVWRPVPRPEQAPLSPQTPDRFRAHGFVPFTRNCMSEVYPDDIPKPEEIARRARFAAVPGLRAQFTVSLRTVAELEDFALTWTDLAGPGGARIPRECITPQIVRNLHAKDPSTHNYAMRKGGYVVKPEVLDRRVPRFLPKDASLRFWFTVMPPEPLPEGVYEGTVSMGASGYEEYAVPIHGRVIGTTLPPHPNCCYGFYVQLPLHFLAAPGNRTSKPEEYARTEEELRAIIRDFRDHLLDLWVGGFFPYRVDAEKRPHVDGALMRVFMDACKAEGYQPRRLVWTWNGGQLYRAYRNAALPKVIREDLKLPQSYFEGMVDIAGQAQRLCRRNGWPQVLCNPLDEPGAQEFIKYAIRVFKAIREGVPGMPLYCTVYTGNAARLRPYLDILCFCDGPVFSGEEAVRDTMRTNPDKFWIYQNYLGCRSRNEMAFARFLTGFFNWRMGIHGSTPWAYNSKVGNPFCNFGHFYRGGGVVFPSSVDSAPLSSPCLEGYTQGIIDARAIHQVEKLVAEIAVSSEARRRGIAAQVRAELEALKADVPGAFEFLQRYEGGQRRDWWPNATMDRRRQRFILLAKDLARVRDGDDAALAGFPQDLAPAELFPRLETESQGRFRRKVWDDFENGIAAWDKGDPNVPGRIPELSMCASTRVAVSGRHSAEFRVAVDWEQAGHGNYKQGWPMATWRFPAPIPVNQALALEFGVRLETTMKRAEIPDRALRYGIVTDLGKEPEWKDVLGVKPGEWRTIRAPMPTKGAQVHGLRVYIAESWYRDGDKFSFFFDDIATVEAAGVCILRGEVAPGHLGAEDDHVVLRLMTAGDAAGASVEGRILDLAGGIAGTAATPVSTPNTALRIPARGLSVGHYFVEARMTRGGQSIGGGRTWLKKIE